ncbi:MAG: hypothetical protein ISR65_01110 [Bacteriovoracaceae bacterium]|nr:hypothetical protein [Bacteriovoracaceae bacterium]
MRPINPLFILFLLFFSFGSLVSCDNDEKLKKTFKPSTPKIKKNKVPNTPEPQTFVSLSGVTEDTSIDTRKDESQKKANQIAYLTSAVETMELAFANNPLRVGHMSNLAKEVLPYAYEILSLSNDVVDTNNLASLYLRAELFLTVTGEFDYPIKHRPLVRSFFDGFGRGIQFATLKRDVDYLQQIDEKVSIKDADDIATLLAYSITSELTSIKKRAQKLYKQYNSRAKLLKFLTSINQQIKDLNLAVNEFSNALDNNESKEQLAQKYLVYYQKHSELLDNPSVRFLCLDSALAAKFGRFVAMEDARLNTFDDLVTPGEITSAIDKTIYLNLDEMISQVNSKSGEQLLDDIIFYPSSVAEILVNDPTLMRPVVDILSNRFEEVYNDQVFANRIVTYLDYASLASVATSLSTFGVATSLTWGAKWAVKRTIKAALVKKVANGIMSTSAFTLATATSITGYNTYQNNYDHEHFEKAFMAGLSPSAKYDAQKALAQYNENLTRLIITGAFTAIPIGTILSFSKRMYKKFPNLKLVQDDIGIIASLSNTVLSGLNKVGLMKNFNQIAKRNPMMSAFARQHVDMGPTARLPEMTAAQKSIPRVQRNLKTLNDQLAARGAAKSTTKRDYFAGIQADASGYNQTAFGSRLEATRAKTHRSNPFAFNHVNELPIEPGSALAASMTSAKNAKLLLRTKRFAKQRARIQARRTARARKKEARIFLNLPRPNTPKAIGDGRAKLLLEHKPSGPESWNVIALPGKIAKKAKGKVKAKKKK